MGDCKYKDCVWRNEEPHELSYEELLEDRDFYKKRFKEFCKLTDRLRVELLGPGYYVTFSCGEPQASEVIIDEVIRKYGRGKVTNKTGKSPLRDYLKNKGWL
jgi:hypothetical protein